MCVFVPVLERIRLPGTGVSLAFAAWRLAKEDADVAGEGLDSSDQQVIRRVLAGDVDAFSRIVGRYQGTIARQMGRFSRDAGVVEELVHDVFVQAFISLKSYRKKSPLLHWLRKIAVRTGYRYWKEEARRKKRVVRLSERAEQLEAPDRLNPTEANDAMHALLGLLAPRDRLVLTLIYWDGLSTQEAARMLGWTAAMVRVQAFRARKRLKRLLEEKDHE